MDDDWITARYLLSSILGRNPLVVDHVDDESFPVDHPRPPAEEPAPAPARKPPPAVRAPPGVAGTVCAVCTDEIAVADAVVRLPCAHWYHAGCIAPWLGIRSTCPLCRAEMPTREDDAGVEGGVGREKRRHEAAGTSVAGAAVRREASYGRLAAAGGVLSG
ncbi:E3 ubiquitin-protein ligase SIRP1-like [Lolium rigidum]|uniref:E3 ubiquitin-protein ligase SIRP1-like n=1 Tax=Lolium rigidum TaxID=89674 RepID=UPI001F5D715E|nr:E3 ubiquitin-protein ligase SIRP1-like [Lolium rigidum]